MLNNYLKIAWRNMIRGKLYSVINIIGLAVGIACCLLILLYIRKELSYDRFHEKADRIYRISESFKNSDGWLKIAWASGPVGLRLKEAVPEIEVMAQIARSGENTVVQSDGKLFYEDRFTYATPSLFEIFDFQVLTGNPRTSLREPYNVLLSKSMADKYFSGEDPLGKKLIINNVYTYTVTGVFKDIPDNSHIQFDFVASRESQYASGLDREDWYSGGAHTYVLLEEQADPEAFRSKLDKFRDKYLTGPFKSEKGKKASVALTATPLTDIHLYTDFSSEMIPQGDITYVYIFSAIALLILLIACINYINLATARAVKRSREVGIRKASGAQRGELVRQYLSEAFLFVTIALILALLLAELSLPVISNIMQRTMEINWTDPLLFILFGGLWITVGLGAGGYPALYLSGFKPVRVLKGVEQIQSKGGLRKVLVTFQLAVSIALIVCTLVIQNQMDLVRESRPGFNREQVIMIPTHKQVDENYDILRSQLLSYSGVESVTTSSFEPGVPGFISFFSANDMEGLTTEKPFKMDGISAGFDFVETFGLRITQGRSFAEVFETDLEQAVMVNEKAVEALGWDEPVGKTIKHWGARRKVVGVVEDFHYKSLKEEVAPLIISPTNEASRFIAVRLAGGAVSSTLSQIESVWNEIIPQLPFTYSFLDDAFDALYRTELRLNTLLSVFSVLAIFVACLGLFGLSAFTAEQRSKEIGIRKILGATVQNILALLTKDVSKWVALGFLIAVPVGHYAMSRWLQTFEYKVEVGAGMYLAAGAIAFALVLITVSWQSIRAALANPVDSLRSE